MNNINNENIPINRQQEPSPEKGKKTSPVLKKNFPDTWQQTRHEPQVEQRPLPRVTVETFNKANEFQLLRNFVQFLTDNLDTHFYKKEIDRLWSIGIDKRIFDSVDLLKVKASLLTIRDQILMILKDIKADDLENLHALVEDKELPTDFDNILDLAALLQSKGSKIRIVHQLLDHGEVGMALYITSKIDSENKRKEALVEIAEDYEKQVDPDKIPENIRFDLLTTIFKHVVKKREPDHILELGTIILNSYSSYTVKRASHFYSALSKLDTDLFVKLAETVPPEKRENFLEKFFLFLQGRNEIDRATEIAGKTGSESILDEVLNDD